jgi:Concanavalin A-like lectin/glucanases superfamily
MSGALVKSLSVQPMARLLTTPYRRGTETLVILLGPDGPVNADGTKDIGVDAYDFNEYRARYGVDPAEPKYVLFRQTDTGRDPLEIEVDFFLQNDPPDVTTVQFSIPPRTFAGTSFAIPLPSTADATLRLKAIRQRPPPLPSSGAGADNFGILALLGNLSKLVWVIGWEKDQIRQYLLDVQQQRHRNLAHGFSLDLLGQDLRVPRFSPREYSFDADTLALYHLNDDFVTRLAVSIDAAMTTIEVTSAFDFPFSLPFRIEVDGEIMIVTAIARSTWSVTRQATAAASHLDGTPVTFVSENGEVADEVKRLGLLNTSLGLTGHPAINRGAQEGVTGKFGDGFALPGGSGAGFIEISPHSDFDLPTNRSFTAEAFVNVDSTDDPFPRMVILKGVVNASGTLTAPGWSLSVARVRGIANNVRWALFDGSQPVGIETFADLNIADGKSHHLAGVLDRTGRRAQLFVDGEERARVDIGLLGALTNGESILIGRSAVGHPLSGVVDELRFSKIARMDFHPVLGEGDEPYRQRLGIFERWLLPTPDALLAAINSIVQINLDPASFVLIEKDRPSAGASKLLRILPASLPTGQNIDRDGSSRTTEAEVSGVPEDDVDFDPMFLLEHNRPKVDYGADPNNRLLQCAAKSALDALIDLLAASTPPITDDLIIDKAFGVPALGLHSVGRAVLLRHQSLALDQLGVMANRAGFDFVQNDGKHVYASVALGEKLEIAIETRPPPETPPPAIDVFIGKAIDLQLVPDLLPSIGQIRWTLIPCGLASAHFVAHPADKANLRAPVTSRAHLRLVAETPGEITVRVEYTVRGRVLTGIRMILISIDSLADGATIAANGDRKISEVDAVGSPGGAINPIYLVTSDAIVSFGDDPNHKKMQIVLERPFKALLNSLSASATGLQVLKAFDPADPGLHKTGRALLLTHGTLGADTLGALAHQAGFGFVERKGAQIHCSVADGEKIAILGKDSAPLNDEAVTNQALDLLVHFTDLPKLTFSIGVGFQPDLDSRTISTGLRSAFATQGISLSNSAIVVIQEIGKRWIVADEGQNCALENQAININVVSLVGTYNWRVNTVGLGSGSFDSVLRPAVKFTPRAPGFLALNVTYLEQDPNSAFPYSFDIRLNPRLEAANAIIPKHQYDLIMNILNSYHPIGVEVGTANIRRHVVEVEQDPRKVFPSRTFPNFRF